MNVRRLAVLLELSRRSSMREVAEELGMTTSSVSQQIAALSREVGTPLLEPVGRHVRLTAAGRRLAEHAVPVIAAVERARRDLDPGAEPAGTVRVGGFASALRRCALPMARELAEAGSALRLQVHELEPREALTALGADDLDLALVYDYSLAPQRWPADVQLQRLWTTRWGLGVPSADPTPQGDAATVLTAHRDRPWITNSRNPADETVLGVLASLADVEPRVEHEIDSLDLVEDLVSAGMGVGLLPLGRPPRPGVRVLALDEPRVTQRAFAATRAGREQWSPLRAVLGRLPRPE